jgi:hypothetical protein
VAARAPAAHATARDRAKVNMLHPSVLACSILLQPVFSPLSVSSRRRAAAAVFVKDSAGDQWSPR